MRNYSLPHMIGAAPEERQAILYALWILQKRGMDTSPFTRAKVYTSKHHPGTVYFDHESDDVVRVDFTGPGMEEWRQRCRTAITKNTPWKPRTRKISGVTLTEHWRWGKFTESVLRQSINRLSAPYSGYFRRSCGWPKPDAAYRQLLAESRP